MEENMKFIEFNKYCPKCKYEKVDESEDPCDECLSVPARQYSHKPIKFEEAKK